MEKWSMDTTVYSGMNALSQLSKLGNQRICLVCDPYLSGSDKLDEILSHIPTTSSIKIYSDIVPDPPIQTVATGVAQMVEHQPSVLIGIGGGSAIDTAKAMLFMYRKMTKKDVEQFVAIPTTSGTGSEVTSASVVTDVENKRKYPIFHRSLRPTIALLDPSLVLSSPKTVTAYSGLDVLTHALEALVASNHTRYTDALSEEAIDLVMTYLPTCFNDPQNIEARKAMHDASCLAGMAFDAAGLGACHAIAHQVGAQFHVPHGLANIMLLPYVVEANAKDSKSLAKYKRIGQKIGIVSQWSTDQLVVEKLKKTIISLSKELECPVSLTEFGISRRDALAVADEIANRAITDATYGSNPILLTVDEMKKIYEKII